MAAANPNADPILLYLIDLAKTSGKLDPLLRASAATPGFALAGTGATVVGDRIALDILLQDGAEADAAQAALEAAGMTGVQVDGRAASGWIDADALPALDALDVVAFARLVYGQAHTGSVGAEGSLAINADAGRADFGVDGSGVAVGALSDSFNALSGAQSDIASGDLPTVVVLEDSAGTDEGRAMLQIVHDVAPGADLLFHTANGGQANFAQGIRDLAAAGASVIVDDIVYLAEPFFQDGLVSRAVDDVFADGVAYFSSAGNAARDSYEAAFVGSGQALTLQGSNGPVDFGEMHDFDPGAGVDVRQRVTVPNGGDLFITFQWDQPFASVSSGGRASASDLDILLFGAAGGLETANLFDLSASFNVGGDPVEVFRFVNNTASTQFDLVITHFSGPEAGLLKYVDLGRATISEHDTNSGATFGHAPAAGGLGVGAAFWGQTPNNGQSPPLLESFSSAGPTTILFADDGARLAAPEIRASPDIVGPDGTNNTFFGQDIAFDADTAPNFFGTSAAAPHVAAVAALMLEANPLLTPAEIYAALQSTAIDMGVAGFDEDSGFGLVDAAAALAAIVPTGPTEGADALTGTPDADTLNGLGGDDIILGLGADDLLIGGPGADEMIGGPGDDLYDVDDVGDAVVELEGEGIDTVVSAIDFALPDFVENLRLNGIGLSGTGNGLANIILGGAGDDILNGGAGDDVLTGGAGVDRVDYAAESGGGAVAADLLAGTATDTFGDSDTLVGILNVRAGAGGDTLRGDDGANVLDGGAGGDRLVGHGGADTLIGGGDRDRVDYSYESGGGAVFADFATGVFIDTHGDTDSLVEVESITGGAAADRLFGDAGDNGLSGAAGDDLIVGRAGADTLVGGDGFDTLDYAQDGGAGAVTVDLAARSATDTHGDTDFVFGFEEVIGTDQADVLMGDALANRFLGGAGDDTLLGGDGDDELQGGAGADSMDGGLGDDIYRVEAAGDRILDAGGVDRVEASIDFGLQFGLENLTLLAGATRGSGNSQANHLIGSDSDDVLLGGAGDDLLEGGAGADALAGHAGADQLNGGDGDDTLLGREGDDVLTGGAGADLMVGGLGNDLYIVDSLADRVVEDADGGADAVQSGITYRLAANVEDLTLTGAGAIDGAGNSSANGVVGNDSANVLLGGAGDDILTGGGGGDAIAGHVGADQLNGGAGDDVLLGREGDDILTGGAGQDRLLGGVGVDRFVFNPGDGADTVVDYVNGVDRLAFLGFGFADANAVLALASAVGADIRFDLADGGVVLVEGAAALGVAAGDLLV